MFDPSFPLGWLSYADRSYIAARLLWFTGLRMDVPVLAHRALELYLKSYLASKGERIAPGTDAWGHVLSDLGAACGRHSTDFNQQAVRRRLGYYDRFFELVRYPSKLDSLPEGQLLWFGFDANVQPMDELVAFIRPRIELRPEEWALTEIATLLASDTGERGLLRRALSDRNPWIDPINCAGTARPEISFSEEFRYDLPGC